MADNKLIIANWKSNKNPTQAAQWQTQFRELVKSDQYQYVICPPSYLLSQLQPSDHDRYVLGVQDVSPFEAGAYTGEIAASLLAELGVQYALVGHSERRKYLGETSRLVAQKAELAAAAQITPIVCLDRDQIQEQADQIPRSLWSQIIIAYEPVHAISTFGGHEDPIETTLQVIADIHDTFGDNTRVLYGGSVNTQNSLAYLNQPSIAGVLVGGTSLDAEQFVKL